MLHDLAVQADECSLDTEYLGPEGGSFVIAHHGAEAEEVFASGDLDECFGACACGGWVSAC